jgi:hypothetical protein
MTLTPEQKLETLWLERAERAGVVKALRLAQTLAALAVALLTGYIAARGGV